MNASQIYFLISIAILLVILIFFVFFIKRDKKRKKITSLAGIAFAFVLAGVIFGDDRLIGYSLIGIGVLIAIIDIIKNRKK